jgi:hypothetical protein
MRNTSRSRANEADPFKRFRHARGTGKIVRRISDDDPLTSDADLVRNGMFGRQAR